MRRMSGHFRAACLVLQVYIEGLYDEELPQRAAAADMLCQLFRISSNMQVSRVLVSEHGMQSCR